MERKRRDKGSYNAPQKTYHPLKWKKRRQKDGVKEMKIEKDTEEIEKNEGKKEMKNSYFELICTAN